jgi:hypothetical protein
MKFLSAIVACSVLLADLGSAFALPSSNSTLSKRDDPHNAPYVACTPTGAGSCNLGFQGGLVDGCKTTSPPRVLLTAARRLTSLQSCLLDVGPSLQQRVQ